MANKFKKVTLIQGGNSSEREVSLRSAAAIGNALVDLGYEIRVFDPKENDYAQLLANRPDAAFIALHGKEGEDGKMQGLLECLKIPYCGSGVLSSALCYDKIRTKIFLKHYGVLTPDFLVFNQSMSTETFVAQNNVTCPVIVKPSREGSTVGMTIVKEQKELKAALDQAMKFCSEALIESFITGKEITVGVLNGKALPIIEVAPKSGFYDYESKYTPGKTDYILPARIDETLQKEIAELSENIYRWLDCRGAARLDYMINGHGQAYFLEINTIPGMTETSLLPKAAKAAGIDFGSLCEQILLSASLET